MKPFHILCYFLSLCALLLFPAPSFGKTKSPLNKDTLYYLPSYGQSLSVGWTGVPVVSDKTIGGNLMFKSGIRPYETDNNRSGFAHLAESASPDNRRGETPLAGTVEAFSHFSRQSSKRKSDIRFLCAANGVGGASIRSLGRGSSAYNRILDDLKAASEISKGWKSEFSMPAFLWTQGETDQQNKESKDWYKEQVLKLISDLGEDAKKITGQKNTPLCFGYQVGSHLHYYQHNPTDYATIAVAQLELALDEKSGYIMTTPMYHLEYSDGVHLPAHMSKLYGAHIGYVMKKVLVDGVKWKPIHPVSHRVNKQGNNTWQINLNFYVPVPPLVIDEKTVQTLLGNGFSVVAQNNEQLPIKSVKLTGKKSLVITVEGDPSNANVRYGMSINEYRPSGSQKGARGNIRDSQGNTIQTTIANKVYRLDNWCPFFDYPLKK